MNQAEPAVRLPAGVRFIERDWLSSNMVLIAEPDGGATLIDSGYVKHAALVVALVEHALGQIGAQRCHRSGRSAGGCSRRG